MRPDIRGYKAAADRAGVCVRTMKTYVRRGRVRAFRVSPRIIMFNSTDIDAMLTSRPTIKL